MKIRIIFLFLLITGLCRGQITFNPDIGGRSEKAKIAVRPYYSNLMYKNYRDIEVKAPPEWADKLEYEWAIEHKTLPLELWLHIDPGCFALTNARVNALAHNLTADLVTDIEPFSEQLTERIRCSSGHWARVRGIDPSFSNKSAGIIMSSYKGDCGLMEFYLVFDEAQFEKVKEEIELMMLAFCFRPEPKGDESAGVGVKISFDANMKMFCFQEVGKGASAYEAGFLPGDILLNIDGKESINLEDIYSVTQMLKGAENTEVEVKVYRDGLLFTNKIIRKKFNPELVTFLTTGSMEVIHKKVKILSHFLLDSEDALMEKGKEAGKDPLGNQKWEYNLLFPGGFHGILTHNTYLLDKYEISYKLTNEKNYEKSEEVYNIYKSILEESFGEAYNTVESRDDDGMVRYRVLDPIGGALANYIQLTLDDKNISKSVMIEYIYPRY